MRAATSMMVLSLGVLGAYATPIMLGTAGSFAVLAGSTVTNTDSPTKIFGNLGVWDGTEVTGFGVGLGVVTGGTIHAGGVVAMQAQADLLTAYNSAFAQPCPGGNNLTDENLGDRTLLPGVYCFDSSAQLTGELILDFLGDPAAAFLFQIGTSLTTASDSAVTTTNGGPNNRLFWQVGSSAILGTNTIFAGNIMADQSITLNTSARILCGRALAIVGAVTLDDNLVSADCASEPFATRAGDFGSLGFSGGIDAGAAVPEPGTVATLGVGIAALILLRKRQRNRI